MIEYLIEKQPESYLLIKNMFEKAIIKMFNK